MIPRPVHRHEDERRILIEWISNFPVKCCKLIEIKSRSILGKHYHLKKDSVFYIYKGKCQYDLKEMKRNGMVKRGWLFEGESLSVPRNFVHTFDVFPGTIMLEAVTEPYDKEDEIQVVE